MLRDAFREQIEALSQGGVDLILFETFGSVGGADRSDWRRARGRAVLPLVAQMTFLDDGRSLAGETPAEVARQLEGLDLAAMGANCTLGPQGLLEILTELARHTSLPLAAQPNAGSPSFVDGRFQYTADPAYFARYAARYAQAGAALVGGCCGTTPAHVEAVVAAVKGLRPPGRRTARAAAAARRAETIEAATPVSSSRTQSLAGRRLHRHRRAASAYRWRRRPGPARRRPPAVRRLRRRAHLAAVQPARPG